MCHIPPVCCYGGEAVPGKPKYDVKSNKIGERGKVGRLLLGEKLVLWYKYVVMAVLLLPWVAV